MKLNNRQRAKLTLDELEKEMEILTKEEMNACKGGGSGTQTDPYTWAEYESLMDDPNFTGGWVMDSGNLFYGLGSVTVSGNKNHPPSGVSGNDCPRSCVFNVFDYLDGDQHDACHYYNETKRNLGYEPESNGGVLTKDIATIGSYGGFEVKELSSPVSFYGSSGNSYPNNNNIMLTFGSGTIDHAVILKGIEFVSGIRYLKYYDPTNNCYGRISEDEATSMYEIIPK